MVDSVAPFAGAWIEIRQFFYKCSLYRVAPFAGAWIEIALDNGFIKLVHTSLPSRERGLKFV